MPSLQLAPQLSMVAMADGRLLNYRRCRGRRHGVATSGTRAARWTERLHRSGTCPAQHVDLHTITSPSPQLIDTEVVTREGSERAVADDHRGPRRSPAAGSRGRSGPGSGRRVAGGRVEWGGWIRSTSRASCGGGVFREAACLPQTPVECMFTLRVTFQAGRTPCSCRTYDAEPPFW